MAGLQQDGWCGSSGKASLPCHMHELQSHENGVLEKSVRQLDLYNYTSTQSSVPQCSSLIGTNTYVRSSQMPLFTKTKEHRKVYAAGPQ